VDINIEAAKDGDSVVVKSNLDLVVLPKEIRMRLRSGDGRPLRIAKINGKKTKVFNDDTILLPRKTKGKYTIVGYFEK